MYIFGIENKIRETNENEVKKQLNDEILQIKRYRNVVYDSQPPIGFIFLTPSKSTVNVSDDEVKIKNLIWNKPKNDEKHEESIYYMLSEILIKEAHGEFEPIFEYTRHTIKALMKFIESGFKLYSEEKAGEKWKKILWGPEDYDKFKSINNSHPKFNLLEEIHNDITQKYKNIRFKISPNKKRISYSINDERKTGNKFFHIQLKSNFELEGFIKVEDVEKNPINYRSDEDSNVYKPSIKSEEDYNKCKDLIKESYDNILKLKRKGSKSKR